MPQGAEPPIHERWWLMRQFSEADRDAHSAKLKLKRELRDYLLAQMERYEITIDDLSTVLAEQSTSRE